ncbi:MAG: hypothetical protein HY843_01370 [Bdellovibrio sp.]|nr:hypothetical protein [Bdellovibrio sp.]
MSKNKLMSVLVLCMLMVSSVGFTEEKEKTVSSAMGLTVLNTLATLDKAEAYNAVTLGLELAKATRELVAFLPELSSLWLMNDQDGKQIREVLKDFLNDKANGDRLTEAKITTYNMPAGEGFRKWFALTKQSVVKENGNEHLLRGATLTITQSGEFGFRGPSTTYTTSIVPLR